MPSTMRSPGTPPRLPRVPGVVLVLARTGANSLCRGPPAVVLAGVASEVPRVRNVARAGGVAETPHVDELAADRAVALHDQIVRLRLRARHQFSIKETTVVVRTTDTVRWSMPHAVRFGGAAVSPSRPLSHAVMSVRSRGVRRPDPPAGRLAGVVLVDVGARTLHRGRPKAHHAVMLNEPPGAFLSGRNDPLLFDELMTPPTGSTSHGSSMRSGAPQRHAPSWCYSPLLRGGATHRRPNRRTSPQNTPNLDHALHPLGAGHHHVELPRGEVGVGRQWNHRAG